MKRPSRCLNCDHPLDGGFCSQCGQRASDLNLPFRQLLGDLLGAFMAFDSRLLRTVGPFLRRPGLLTVEYNAGGRVRYVPPIRLYIFMSFLTFLTLSLVDVPFVVTASSSSSQGNREAAQSPASSTAPAEAPAVETTDTPAVEDDSSASTTGFFEKIEQTAAEKPELVSEKLMARIPQVLFLFVPIYALLLKLLYLRRGVLYIQHLTFSAYYHAFVFFMIWILVSMFALGVSDDTISRLRGVVIVVLGFYLFFSLRRVYGQSLLKTLVKMGLLTLTYAVLLSAGILATAFLSVFLL